MAAKLCKICKGSGKVLISSLEVVPAIDACVDIPIIIRCEECEGLGYIPIKKRVET